MKEEIQKTSKTELTSEEKATAYSLENLPTFSMRGKMDLMLVWRKLKSASQLYLHADLSDREFQDIKNKIENAGLFFLDKGIDERLEGVKPVRLCFVANNVQDLNLISELWYGDHLKDPKVYKEIGRMSGFPETAINIFDQCAQAPKEIKEETKQKLVLAEDEKKKLFPADLYPFSILFYMSKEHWKTELETVRKWAQELKLVAPSLYQEYMKAFK